nr:MAG TPA: hypothetical protein [Caudoviricetes sp.]
MSKIIILLYCSFPLFYAGFHHLKIKEIFELCICIQNSMFYLFQCKYGNKSLFLNLYTYFLNFKIVN